MAHNQQSDENILKVLSWYELKPTVGVEVASMCRSVGASDAAYYEWRRRFGETGRAHLTEMKSLEKVDTRLKCSRDGDRDAVE